MRKFKPSKGQVVAGGLAVLIAAAGVTGATVTAQSTIADNKYTVQDANTPAPVITATGAPFDVTVVKGIAAVQQGGIWTVKNTGNKAATVKAILDNSKFVGNPGVPSTVVTVNNGNVMLQQAMNEAHPETQTTFNLDPGEEKRLRWSVAGGTPGPDVAVGTYSMDLKFDYVPAS
ncbi:hypothetical protein V3C41_00540 [Paenarthrobacter nicotinovorans]|uniref:Uncharacterized protein n=1 Tax=Paenarthrobacter nicotinovorans TaxID=29320 RepID=A0ABV0GLZ3_PAENI